MSQARNILDTPWKGINELKRRIALPYIRFLFALHSIPWEGNYRFYGVPIIEKHRLSQMRFGRGMQLRSSVRSNPLGPNHAVILATWKENAILAVGDNFGMSGGVLCAAECISIGNRVVVGANTIIIDTDFHPSDIELRQMNAGAGATEPVKIEDDVFIGMNSLILKGVTIGRGSVIGAGSVVTGSIPPFSIAAGNPARVIQEANTSAKIGSTPKIELMRLV